MTPQPLFALEPQPALAGKTPTPAQAARVCKVHQTLTEAFGQFQQGTDYPYSSGAEWSTHDLILYMIDQIGPAHLTACTWSVAEHAAHKLIGMLEARDLLSINMLVDWRVQVRTPAFMPLAKTRFSKIAVSSCHAKAFVLHNDEWSMSCVTSANFTNNPRIEAGHISTNPAVGDFHRQWIQAEIDKAAPFGADMRKMGKKDGRA